MDLTENLNNHPNMITSAQVDLCVIGGNNHYKTIIIPSNGEVIEHEMTSINELSEDLINQLCAYNPELILLATGDHIVYPETGHLSTLIQMNIGLEILSNQAAARTFNVLLAEERKAVCLMLIKST